jgi:ABC-type Fe3+ transport system substrate-binding protein
VYRIKNKNSTFGLWGTAASHASTNILASTGIYTIITDDEEDQLWQNYQKTNKVSIFLTLKVAQYLKYLNKAKVYPIPGSYRDQLQKGGNKILS